MIIKGVGAVATFIVMIVFALTKFKDGAWIVILLTSSLVMVFFSIHHHYKNIARQLSLENDVTLFHASHNRVVVPISGVHQGALAALRFARTISDDIIVVNVATDPAEADKIRMKWEVWGEGIRLVILNSLTPTEYDLIRLLIQNAEKVLTHQQILHKVWGTRYSEEEAHLLRVNISNLRRKIETDPTRPRLIITEPGVGYRFHTPD